MKELKLYEIRDEAIEISPKHAGATTKSRGSHR
jgi:hypothetical protein